MEDELPSSFVGARADQLNRPAQQVSTVQFTEDERRMVEWLRQQHAGWRVTRAIIVTCSSISAVYGTWHAFRYGFAIEPAFYLLVAAVGFSYTLGSWSGRAEISLLLKLIEAQNPDNNSTDPG